MSTTPLFRLRRTPCGALLPVCGLLCAVLLALGPLAGCGGAAPQAPSSDPFVAEFPPDLPGGGGSLPGTTPAPEPGSSPVFDPRAWVHDRVVLYGAFPSDVVVFGDTLFTTDGDQITDEGATIRPLDVSGPRPLPSGEFEAVVLRSHHLVDNQGNSANAAAPIAFGFFLNDLAIVDAGLGFALVAAGGSDSNPSLSNVVAFDPTAGQVLQAVNLARPYPVGAGMVDSAGTALPGSTFLQSGPEALAYVRTGASRGLLYVAMTNLVIGAPSYGRVKYPGTIQVFDVVPGDPVPLRHRFAPSLSTETFEVGGYNPVAVTSITPDGITVPPRLLITVAGATDYDANARLVPVTDAAVVVHDAWSRGRLGSFRLGLAGLAATRPALGADAAGHRVAFFPSAVTGEVYLLLLDGLYTPSIDPTGLAVLRGPHNGIPVAAGQAGGPGGNITAVGLAPDGRTLVVAGFGDLFAFPEALPGRLYLLGLPVDLITGSGFTPDFVPGATLYGTLPGRALGALALVPNGGDRPDVYVAVSSGFDLATYLATGPAALGALQTFGLIR